MNVFGQSKVQCRARSPLAVWVEAFGDTNDAATAARMATRIQRDSLSPQRGEGRGEG
jgi:hypothetical protein